MKVFDVFIAKMKNLSGAIINGKEYSGKSFRIDSGGCVIINGKIQDSVVGTISVVIKGDCNNLSNISGDIKVEGSVLNIETTSGNIDCQQIKGDANTASGDIKVYGNIGGDVETVSGDVDSQSIYGEVETLSGGISDKFYPSK